jgi:hypothetical protein
MSLPLVTNNVPMAVALHLGGALIERVQNVYTPEMLNQWGVDNPLEALKRRKLGKVEIYINPHPRLAQLCARYDEQKERDNLEIESEPSADDLVALAVHVQRLLKWLNSLIWDPDAAWLRVMDESTAKEMEQYQQDLDAAIARAKKGCATAIDHNLLANERNFSVSGIKMIKATAPESTRRHLEL